MVAEGKAKTQVIQTFHYYKRLTTTEGEAVVYTKQEKDALIKFILTDGTLVPDIGTEDRAALTQFLMQTYGDDKGLGVMTDAQTINFTGHSLGGHVAYLFAGLVAESQSTIAVGDMMTYNAPGEGSLLYELINWVIPGTVTSQEGEIGSKHLSFYGKYGVEITALSGKVIGTPVATYIEGSGNPIDNHAITKLSDSLAVYKLLATIDSDSASASPIAVIEKFTPLLTLMAKDHDSKEALENIVYALDKLYLGEAATKIATDERGELYKHVTALQDIIKKNTNTTIITDLSDIATKASDAQSADGIAYRYALKELNPFVIVNETLYNEKSVLKDMLPELV